MDLSPGRQKLRGWLNKPMKIQMSDGRILIGLFVCSDSHQNVILAECLEYLDDQGKDDPRSIGLAMIPGHHIVSIKIYSNKYNTNSGSILA